mmetsp:Transcript_5365/g.14918  ORF Transcript_5365/g.14918 Transcript_5365/m.14918 type:complete len:342 (+) Transcript_5365:160-1185(+)
MSFLQRERTMESQRSLVRTTSQLRADEQLAAQNQMHDPLMREWEASRRMSDPESVTLRRMASGARLMAQKGTGYYSEQKYKMTGYSGYIHSLNHTVSKTPIFSQEETMKPPENTFLYERSTEPIKTPARDPCNDPKNYKKGLPLGQSVNLWPNLQPDPRPNFTGKDKPSSTKPQEVHIVHGDRRIRSKRTAFQLDFKPPSRPNSARAVDPVTLSVMETRDENELRNMYANSHKRVTKQLLDQIFKSMRERIEAKIDVGTNANAFKLRKLFKMFDAEQNGRIELPDFRIMMESFGIQLSEDQLIVVFSLYDKNFEGEIDYLKLMKDLLDGDYFQFYKNGLNL